LWTAGAVSVAAVVAVVVGRLEVSPTVVPTGQLVIEAVPWATVASIEAEDGSQVPVPAQVSTPWVVDLPEGTYRIRLVGPPPDSVVRVVTVRAQPGSPQTVMAEAFPEMTPEAYFEQYLNAPVEEAAGAAPTEFDRTGPPVGVVQ
jgi:hypothetical protein